MDRITGPDHAQTEDCLNRQDLRAISNTSYLHLDVREEGDWISAVHSILKEFVGQPDPPFGFERIA